MLKMFASSTEETIMDSLAAATSAGQISGPPPYDEGNAIAELASTVGQQAFRGYQHAPSNLVLTAHDNPDVAEAAEVSHPWHKRLPPQLVPYWTLSPNNDGTSICGICNERLLALPQFMFRHQKSQHQTEFEIFGKGPYMCVADHCTYTCGSNEALESHWRSKHPANAKNQLRKHRCYCCEYPSLTTKYIIGPAGIQEHLLARHLFRSQDDGIKFPCINIECGIERNSIRALMNHLSDRPTCNLPELRRILVTALEELDIQLPEAKKSRIVWTFQLLSLFLIDRKTGLPKEVQGFRVNERSHVDKEVKTFFNRGK